MHLLSLRKRVLNFRLTEDEYQSLKKASQDNRARCVSDYARSLLLSPLPAEEPRSTTDELFRRLDDLETRVSALSATTQVAQPGDPAAHYKHP